MIMKMLNRSRILTRPFCGHFMEMVIERDRDGDWLEPDRDGDGDGNAKWRQEMGMVMEKFQS